MLAAAAVVAAAPSADTAPLRSLFERHGRYLGATVDGLTLTDTAITASVYGTVAGTEFGSLTPRRELGWDVTEPSRGSFNFTRSDPIVEFARRHNQAVRGENLVSDQNLPVWVAGTDAAELRTMVLDHITGVVTHFRGRIAAWHVVSAPFADDGTRRDTVFQRVLGDGYIAEALRAARTADPAAKLYLSDRGMAGSDARSQAMYDLARSLREQGVPLDGVDLQSRLAVGRAPAALRQNLQRFADLGLDVSLSQVEVRIRYPADARQLAQQATDYTTITTACLLVTRCVGMTLGGVHDSESQVTSDFPGFGAPLLFDTAFGKKPAYHGVACALHRSRGGRRASRRRAGAHGGDRR